MKTALAIAVATAGCATIVAGGPDHVPVNTNPPGAYVYVNGQVVGQTPVVVALDRHASESTIQIAMPGFQPIILTREKSFNGWTILSGRSVRSNPISNGCPGTPRNRSANRSA